jgi:CelD/BcsL family acetyltransferase involved in cellulose biosynthesis
MRQTEAGIFVEVLSQVDQLESLRRKWSELLTASPQATPFQSPEWLLPWWKHLGEGQLWTLCLQRSGRLVGLAPWFIYQNSRNNRRELLFLGTGLTDYLDVLLAPDSEAPGMAAIAAQLRANQARWDLCDFQQLRPGSPLLRFQAPGDWNAHAGVQEVCPVLALPTSLDVLDNYVPGHMLRKLAYYRRRAAKLGPVTVELADEKNFEELFNAFLRLHRARCACHGRSVALTGERSLAFHRHAAGELLANGRLRFYALRVGGHLVATLYGFEHNRRVFYYLSGFDPEFATISPGTLLIGQAVEDAIRGGARELDFLRGKESYKYSWGAKDQPTYRLQLWPGPDGRATANESRFSVGKKNSPVADAPS